MKSAYSLRTTGRVFKQVIVVLSSAKLLFENCMQSSVVTIVLSSSKLLFENYMQCSFKSLWSFLHQRYFLRTLCSLQASHCRPFRIRHDAVLSHLQRIWILQIQIDRKKQWNREEVLQMHVYFIVWSDQYNFSQA